MWFKVIVKTNDGRVIPNVWHINDIFELMVIDHLHILDEDFSSVVGLWQVSQEEAYLSSWRTYRIENIFSWNEED